MKKLLVFIISILLLNGAGAVNHYFSFSTGTDTNNGLTPATAKKTLAQANIDFSGYIAGDSVLFMRGDIFYGTLVVNKSGVSGAKIVIGSYGTGNKPIISGAKVAGTWINVSGNVWKVNTIIGATVNTTIGGIKDISNVIFNNDALCGVKRKTYGEMTTQGNYWYSPTGDSLYLFSSSNPNTFYTDIKIAGVYSENVIKLISLSNVTLTDLDIRYSGNNAIFINNCNGVTVKNCNVSLIGGWYFNFTSGARMGNGIQLWEGNTNIEVAYNVIRDMYDAGVSPQGGSIGYTQSNINIHHNIIDKTHYSYELFIRSPNIFSNIVFEYNICTNAGGQWSQSQRIDPANNEHIRQVVNTGTYSGLKIRYNEFINSIDRYAQMDAISPNMICDYNTIVNSTSVFGRYAGVDKADIVSWRTASSFDINSNIVKTKYYFSSSGNDITGSGSIENPYQTIAKANSIFSSLNVGDSILFKRGDIFYGTLVVNKSGVSGAKIVIGSYGIGNKPIFTGFTNITGWTNEGGGIFSKVIVSEAQTNMVTINGVQYAIGRYPDAAYLTYESFVTNISITDNQLPATPNWTGAEAAIRKNDWTIDRCTITNHTGTVINYTSLASNLTPIGTGYGYFIQNDLRTLTTFGEWYHNTATGKFYMYFGTVDPNTKSVNVATLNNLLFNNGFDFIDLENINFTGSISNAVNYRYNHISCEIKNNGISFSGAKGIVVLGGSVGTLIISNNIRFCNSVGIDNGDQVSCTVEYNDIYGIGLLAGQSLTPDNGVGISSYQSAGSGLVQYNTIRSTGYNGVTMWRYGSCIVQYNRIDSVCLVLDDGAGIYTGGQTTGLPRIIRGNIISNAIGNSSGTPNNTPASAGVYLDELAQNVNVIGNSIFNINYAGLKNHKINNNTITGNTIYNCLNAIRFEDNIGNQNRNNYIWRNILFGKTANQYVWYFRSPAEDANLYGSSDSNYFCRPINDSLVFYLQQQSGVTLKTLAQWQAFTGQDARSHKSPKTIVNVNELDFQFNDTEFPVVYKFKGFVKMDVTGKKYTDSIIIEPYTSVILFNIGAVGAKAYLIMRKLSI